MLISTQKFKLCNKKWKKKTGLRSFHLSVLPAVRRKVKTLFWYTPLSSNRHTVNSPLKGYLPPLRNGRFSEPFSNWRITQSVEHNANPLEKLGARVELMVRIEEARYRLEDCGLVPAHTAHFLPVTEQYSIRQKDKTMFPTQFFLRFLMGVSGDFR